MLRKFQKIIGVILCLALLLTAGCASDASPTVTLTPAPMDTLSDCAQRIVGSNLVVATQTLNVNQDSVLDEVVIYLDAAQRKGYLILILNYSSGQCEMVLQDYIGLGVLSNTVVESPGMSIYQISTVEVTGDDYPELYVQYYDEDSWAESPAITHIIYTAAAEGWQTIFVRSPCSGFSKLEFRDGPDRSRKDIYFEDTETEHGWCDPFDLLLSTTTQYKVYRWDREDLITVQEGNFKSTQGIVWDSLCGLCYVSPILVLAWVIWKTRKARQRRKLDVPSPENNDDALQQK